MSKTKEKILYIVTASICTAVVVIYMPCAFGYDGTADWYRSQASAVIASPRIAWAVACTCLLGNALCYAFFRRKREEEEADDEATAEIIVEEEVVEEEVVNDEEPVIISDEEPVIIVEEVHRQRTPEEQETLEQVGLEIRTYVLRTMTPYMRGEHIDTLCANILEWHEKKAALIVGVVSDGRLSAIDLRHLAWNIGERLNWSGIKRAMFIKQCFPNELRDQETETIRRNLRQKASCIIPIDEPEKGDYHFHDT